MSGRALPSLVALAATFVLSASSPATEAAAIQPLEARVAFSRGERCRVRLDADLLADDTFRAFVPGRDRLRIVLAGTTVFDGVGTEDGTRLRTRRSGWRLNRRKAFDGRGRLLLAVEPPTGTVRLVLRGFPAAVLREAGPDGIAVRFEFGADAVYDTALDLEAEGERRWSFSHVAPPRPVPPGGGGGGGDGGTPPPAPGPVGAVTVARGTQSNIGTFQVSVVRDTAAWTALWAQHGGGGTAPAVDFSRDMIIGVWLGTRPTLGYTLNIRGVHVSGGVPNGSGIVLNLEEIAPGAGCIVGQAITQPFHIVRTPRVVGTTIWELSTVTYCP